MKWYNKLKYKIIIYVAILIVLLFSFSSQIIGCPHMDENGDIYWLFPAYDNQENTVVLYQRDYYNFLTYYNNNFEQLYHEYEIYLYQEYNIYATFTDEGDTNTALTVEGIEKVEVISDDYRLVIPVEKAYLNTKKYINDNLSFMYYLFQVSQIDHKMYSMEYEKINNILKKYPLKNIGAHILSIDAYNFKLMNIDRAKKPLNEFFEPIDVIINLDTKNFSEEQINNLVAVKIVERSNNSYSLKEIGGKLNIADNTFSFSTNVGGIYTIIEKNGVIDSSMIININGNNGYLSNVNASSIIKFVFFGIITLFVTWIIYKLLGFPKEKLEV